jgi:hypothetical protein
MEMRLLVDAHFGQASVADVPEYQQLEWVGRMLRPRAGNPTQVWGALSRWRGARLPA